jgi:hypothetical protein
MNMAAMRSVPSPYDRALKEQRRRKVEKDLSCPACGRGNRPGNIQIDIEENDDAHCPCGNIFNVFVS